MNPVVLCLQCFRGTKKLPAVCGRECIAIGGGQFKCAKEVGHQAAGSGGCQGVTQDGLLKTEDVGAAERRADPKEVKRLEEEEVQCNPALAEDVAVVRWLRGQANLYHGQTPDARNVALAILACANGIDRGEHR